MVVVNPRIIFSITFRKISPSQPPTITGAKPDSVFRTTGFICDITLVFNFLLCRKDLAACFSQRFSVRGLLIPTWIAKKVRNASRFVVSRSSAVTNITCWNCDQIVSSRWRKNTFRRNMIVGCCYVNSTYCTECYIFMCWHLNLPDGLPVFLVDVSASHSSQSDLEEVFLTLYLCTSPI